MTLEPPDDLSDWENEPLTDEEIKIMEESWEHTKKLEDDKTKKEKKQ